MRRRNTSTGMPLEMDLDDGPIVSQIEHVRGTAKTPPPEFGEPRPLDPDGIDRPLDPVFEPLAIFNAERHRGIVHTPEYNAAMNELQRKFDAWATGPEGHKFTGPVVFDINGQITPAESGR